MPLLNITELSYHLRGKALLDAVSCRVEPRERIGLLGRNGAGKTTFMRLLCGEIEGDGGTLAFHPGSRVARLPQEVPLDLAGPVTEIVRQGFDANSQEPEWQEEQRSEHEPGARDRRHFLAAARCALERAHAPVSATSHAR